MTAALLDNKFDFVKLFLREGINLKSFLTIETLLTLYREVRNTLKLWIAKNYYYRYYCYFRQEILNFEMNPFNK